MSCPDVGCVKLYTVQRAGRDARAGRVPRGEPPRVYIRGARFTHYGNRKDHARTEVDENKSPFALAPWSFRQLWFILIIVRLGLVRCGQWGLGVVGARVDCRAVSRS